MKDAGSQWVTHVRLKRLAKREFDDGHCVTHFLFSQSINLSYVQFAIQVLLSVSAYKPVGHEV